MKLDRVAPLIADPPPTSSTALRLCAGVCRYKGGGGGVTEGAQVEAMVKDLVGDLVGDMVGAKVETQANIYFFLLIVHPR